MPTDPRCFAVRAIVWAQQQGVKEDKRRICVVLRVETDRLEVAYGQGEPSGSGRDLIVRPGDARAKRYRPSKPTYFRPTNITNIRREDVGAFIGTCSTEDLLLLQGFADAVHVADAPTDRNEIASDTDKKPR